MDICYFLGSESAADDWEMRYSMRSWWQNLREPLRIHVVGHLPAWLLTNEGVVVHHPFPDSYKKNKDANLIQKALYLASNTDVSQLFILCSDDQMLLRPAKYADLATRWHCGPISGYRKIPGHSWWDRLHRTSDALRRRKLTEYHFDTHVPHILWSHEVLEALKWDYGAGGGYCVFSLILNASSCLNIGHIDSAHIKAGMGGSHHSEDAIRRKLAENLYLSIDGDSLKCPALVRAIEERLPTAAPWELYQPRSPLDFKNLYPVRPPDPEPPFDYTNYAIQ